MKKNNKKQIIKDKKPINPKKNILKDKKPLVKNKSTKSSPIKDIKDKSILLESLQKDKNKTSPIQKTRTKITTNKNNTKKNTESVQSDQKKIKKNKKKINKGLQLYNSFRKHLANASKLSGKKLSSVELNAVWKDKKEGIKSYVFENNIPIVDLETYNLYDQFLVEEVSYIVPDMKDLKPIIQNFEWFYFKNVLEDNSEFFNEQDEIVFDASGLGEYYETYGSFGEFWDVFYLDNGSDIRNPSKNRTPVPEIDLMDWEFNDELRRNKYYFSLSIDLPNPKDKVQETEDGEVKKESESIREKELDLAIKQEETKQGESKSKMISDLVELKKSYKEDYEDDIIDKKEYREIILGINEKIKKL